MGFADDVRQIIKDAIDEAGSARKLADRLGMNQSTISRWVSATRNPLSEVGKLLDELGVAISTSPFPHSVDTTTCRDLETEVTRLQTEIRRLELELAKRDGMVEALERQLDRRKSAEQTDRHAPEERRAAG